MAQHVIVEHRGCGYGCFMTFMVLIVAALLISVLPFVGAVAAGFGLYFLMRYIWRQYVQQRPDAPFVQWGLKFAPITRKLMVTLLCSALAASLIAAFAVSAGTGAQSTYSHETQEQPRSGEEPKENRSMEGQDTVTAGFDPASAPSAPASRSISA